MKIRGQMVTAAAATVILFGATSGVFLSGGSRSSLAEPLTDSAIAALKSAVDNPSTALAAALANMDAVQPGSSANFKAALENNTDTTNIANALQQLAAANSALQSTITSALTTLAATPSLASLPTTQGNFLNLPNLVASNGPVLTPTPPTPPTIVANNPPTSGTPNTPPPGQDSLPNPSAPGPQAGGGGLPGPTYFNNPFTPPGQPTGSSNPTNLPSNSGKPASRA